MKLTVFNRSYYPLFNGNEWWYLCPLQDSFTDKIVILRHSVQGLWRGHYGKPMNFSKKTHKIFSRKDFLQV